MAFWSLHDWECSNAQSLIVSDFCDRHFRDGCYRLSLGQEAIVSADASEQNGVRRDIDADGGLQIFPGQFVYLITRERVRIPDASIGLINLATPMKLRGLVNISGFHADPGYSGRIVFTVFNAGGMTLHIAPRERIFRLWLIDFEGESTPKEPGYDTIPHNWADGLVGAYPSPFVIDRSLKRLDNRIDDQNLLLVKRIDELQKELELIKNYRWQIILLFVVMSLFLLPFVASLYAGIFSLVMQHPVNNLFERGLVVLRGLFA